jgi:hypothetical protein
MNGLPVIADGLDLAGAAASSVDAAWSPSSVAWAEGVGLGVVEAVVEGDQGRA